jgi:hypothetical protein
MIANGDCAGLKRAFDIAYRETAVDLMDFLADEMYRLGCI